MSIEDQYRYYSTKGNNVSVDIVEHLPTIKRYASECSSIVEMGVRSMVSSWALLAGHPKQMISIDIDHPSKYNNNLSIAESLCREEGINFKFIQASTMSIEIEETEMLFIDTIHTFEHLSKELKLHGNKAKKFIILHDTISCPEIVPAITEFINDNKEWKIKEHFTNNNGLMIIERHKGE